MTTKRPPQSALPYEPVDLSRPRQGDLIEDYIALIERIFAAPPRREDKVERSA